MVSETLKTLEEKMRHSVEAFQTDLAGVRTGHATPALIEHMKVEYAGVPTPLNHLAAITAPETNLLVVQPWDKSGINSILKGIQKSELGLNPSSDGNIIRIVIPPLNEERRQELIRVVHKRVEERKIIIRGLRHEVVDSLKKMEKDKDISQDEHKRSLEQLQKLTDKTIEQVDQAGQAKEAKLKEV
ncbi:ribosome recycling factor [Chloroflexota bacterium]